MHLSEQTSNIDRSMRCGRLVPECVRLCGNWQHTVDGSERMDFPKSKPDSDFSVSPRFSGTLRACIHRSTPANNNNARAHARARAHTKNRWKFPNIDTIEERSWRQLIACRVDLSAAQISTKNLKMCLTSTVLSSIFGISRFLSHLFVVARDSLYSLCRCRAHKSSKKFE